MSRTETALIVGAGKGLSASLARLFVAEGMEVALAARDTSKLTDLVDETGALALSCDASRADEVNALFEKVEQAFGVPDLVVYNASGRYRAAVEAIFDRHDTVIDRVRNNALDAFAKVHETLDQRHGRFLVNGLDPANDGVERGCHPAWAVVVLQAAGQVDAQRLASAGQAGETSVLTTPYRYESSGTTSIKPWRPLGSGTNAYPPR